MQVTIDTEELAAMKKLKHYLIEGLADETQAVNTLHNIANHFFPEDNIDRNILIKRVQIDVGLFLNEYIEGSYIVKTIDHPNYIEIIMSIPDSSIYSQKYDQIQDFLQELANEYQTKFYFNFSLINSATPVESEDLPVEENPIEDEPTEEFVDNPSEEDDEP